METPFLSSSPPKTGLRRKILNANSFFDGGDTLTRNTRSGLVSAFSLSRTKHELIRTQTLLETRESLTFGVSNGSPQETMALVGNDVLVLRKGTSVARGDGR